MSKRMGTKQRYPQQMWMVESAGEDGDGYREYLCEACAEEFIKEHGITQRNGKYGHWFGHADGNELVFYYSVPSWDQPELDYPMACPGYRYDAHPGAAVWLDHQLTPDGEQYLIEHFGPSVQYLYGMAVSR